MNIERSLVLNRYFHGLFGAERFDELRRVLKEQEEGLGPNGRSRFFHVLAGRSGLKIQARSLEEYDRRIMEYEADLAKRRRVEPFRSFKYFQYLALLYTEMFLDHMTAGPAEFIRELNDFKASKTDFTDIPDFTPDDLRRLAFFMATGSGKTLSSMAFALKHAHLHNLRRIVVVIPYLSIIEQSSSVFRDVLGDEVVVEHHSGVSYVEDGREAATEKDESTSFAQLASENWDAPIIVTTSVQFLESLFARKPSKSSQRNKDQ